MTADAGGNLATSTLPALGIASSADIGTINAQLAAFNGEVNDLYARSSKAYSGVAAGVPTLLPTERFAATYLGQIFADLRRRHVDLFATALMTPQLAAPPALDGNGLLRLTGRFPKQPLRLQFDLLLQNVDRGWRLFGISVSTPEVAPQANLPTAARR